MILSQTNKLLPSCNLSVLGNGTGCRPNIQKCMFYKLVFFMTPFIAGVIKNNWPIFILTIWRKFESEMRRYVANQRSPLPKRSECSQPYNIIFPLVAIYNFMSSIKEVSQSFSVFESCIPFILLLVFCRRSPSIYHTSMGVIGRAFRLPSFCGHFL